MNFWYLSIRTCSPKVCAKIQNEKMRTKHLFNVAFLKQFKNGKKRNIRWLTAIKTMISSCFNSFTDNENESIAACFEKGEVMNSFGFSASSQKEFIIASLLFSADANGIWVHWLAVCNQIYSKSLFGPKATGESF